MRAIGARPTWAALATLVIAIPLGAQTPHAGLRVRLQAKLDSVRATSRLPLPGATFAAALPDGSVIAVASGMSDTTLKIAMRVDDLMPQGSVGKTYVSALAMQLVSEGKLDVSAPVARYLGTEPWFSRLPNGSAITVRHLMNHTSGIVRYEFSAKFTADLTRAAATKVWDPRELIAYVFDRPPPFKAGEGWEYSDTNYMVLGLILEKITGRPMIDEIRRRIIEPLGLRQTVPNLSSHIDGVVQGYAGEGNVFGGTDAMLVSGRFAFNPQFEWAGGGWSSTTSDLARWGKLVYEWKAFDAAVASRFLDGVYTQLGSGVRYGLGVILWPASPFSPQLGEARGHSGFFPGYTTEMRYYPAHRFATALQFNTSNILVARGPAGVIEELSAIVVAGLGVR